MLINLSYRRFLQWGVLFMLLTTATFVQALTRWSDWNVYVWDFNVNSSTGGGRDPVLGDLTDDFEGALIQKSESGCFKRVLFRRDYAQYLSHCQNEAGISGNSCIIRIPADVVINGKLDDNIRESSVRVNITATKFNGGELLSFQSVSLERSELNNSNRRKSKMQELVETLCSGKGIPPTRNPSFLPPAEQAISPSPEQAIKDYYGLINSRRYEDAWEKTTAEFKNRQTFESYKNWWKRVKTVTVKPVKGSDKTPRIRVQLSYQMNDKKSPINEEWDFELLFDDQTRSWLINSGKRIKSW